MDAVPAAEERSPSHIFNSSDYSCEICLTNYNESSRLPKILQCGHTFCLECTFQLGPGDDISCPLCRRITYLRSYGNLTTNFFLLNILQKMNLLCTEPPPSNINTADYRQNFGKNRLNPDRNARRADVSRKISWANFANFYAVIITSAKQFFGKPIQCWLPQEFHENWEQYAEDYCFISNVYVQPYDKPLVNRTQLTGNIHHTDHVSYYPWIPTMLCLQAMCFYFPLFFWKFMQNKTASIYPKAFLKEAEKLNELTGEPRDLELNRLTDHYMKKIATSTGRRATALYLLTKFFYLLNIHVQCHMLSLFIGEDFSTWEYESLSGFLQSQQSSIFPRVVFCDFTTRDPANLRHHTVQCVLMMNMINEKLYLFLYVWFIFLNLATLLDCIYYVCILSSSRVRKNHFFGKLKDWNQDVLSKNKLDIVGRFVNECLYPDGVLLLLFLSDHISGRIASDFATAVITRYEAEHNSSISAPSVCPEESNESGIAKSLLPTVTPSSSSIEVIQSPSA